MHPFCASFAHFTHHYLTISRHRQNLHDPHWRAVTFERRSLLEPGGWHSNQKLMRSGVVAFFVIRRAEACVRVGSQPLRGMTWSPCARCETERAHRTPRNSACLVLTRLRASDRTHLQTHHQRGSPPAAPTSSQQSFFPARHPSSSDGRAAARVPALVPDKTMTSVGCDCFRASLVICEGGPESPRKLGRHLDWRGMSFRAGP